MTREQDAARMARSIAALAAAFPRQPVPRETLAVYARCLRDLDPAALERAVDRLLSTSRFFPTIAEVRAEVSRETLAGMPEPELAWGEVVAELRRVGHTRAPEFSCQEIGWAVRAIGGWEHLCLAERNPADRARFVDAYRAALERTSRDTQLGPRLAGQLPAPVRDVIRGVSTRLQNRLNTGSPAPCGEIAPPADGRGGPGREPETSEASDGDF